MHNYLLMQRTEAIARAQEEQRAHQELQSKTEEKRAKALQDRISVLGILIGVPSLVIGFLGINMKGFNAAEGLSTSQAIEWVGGGGFCFGAAIALMLWRLRR